MENNKKGNGKRSPKKIPTAAEYDAAWARVKKVEGEDGLTYSFVGTKAICGSPKRITKLPCGRPPANDRNRCYMHGGSSPRGIAHPRYKTGKYSKDVIGMVGNRYEAARNAEALLELSDEIALIESRIGQLLQRTDSAESGIAWRKLKSTHVALIRASKTGDMPQVATKINEIGVIIDKGYGDSVAWDEILRTIAHLRRVGESERKRLTDSNQMMTADQAKSLVAFVINVIRQEAFIIVKDESTAHQLLASISSKISTHISNNKRPVLEG